MKNNSCCCNCKSNTLLIWGAFLLFFALVFVFKINEGGLYSPQEARSGLIADNMIKSGDYLTMTIVGDETLQKPVFSYWLTVATMKIFGHNELGVRLPSTLAALITLIATFHLGRAVYGRKVGYLSMFILGSMLSYVHLSRIARIDIVLTALFTVSMLLFYKGYVENNKCTWYIYLFYFVLGISVLTKGPVTVALAGMIIMAYCAKKKDWNILWKVRPISGAVIGLLICMPWFIYENDRTGGEFFKTFFLGHNVERFTGASGQFGKKKPFWFYAPQLFAGAMPWGLLFPVILYTFRAKIISIFWGAVYCIKHRLTRTVTDENRSCTRHDVPFSDKTNFLCFWVIIIFVFFSMSAFKRKDYLLPLYAPLAVLLARYVIGISAENIKSLRRGVKWTVGILSTLFVVIFSAILSGYLQQWAQKVLDTQEKIFHLNTKDAFMLLKISDVISSNLVVSIVIVALIISLIWWCGSFFSKGQNLRGAYCFVILGTAIFTVNELTFVPFKDSYLSSKSFIESSREHIADGEKAVFYKVWNLETAFFLNKPYDRLGSAEEIRAAEQKDGADVLYKYFIFSKEWFNSLSTAKKSAFEVVEQMSDHQRRPLIFCRLIAETLPETL